MQQRHGSISELACCCSTPGKLKNKRACSLTLCTTPRRAELYTTGAQYAATVQISPMACTAYFLTQEAFFFFLHKLFTSTNYLGQIFL